MHPFVSIWKIFYCLFQNLLINHFGAPFPTTLDLCVHASDDLNEGKFVKLLPLSIVSKSTPQAHAAHRENRIF